jgi:hypothetical protein
MSKQITVQLSSAEIEHIIDLMQYSEFDPLLYGNTNYWKRSERIQSKLRIAQNLQTKEK